MNFTPNISINILHNNAEVLLWNDPHNLISFDAYYKTAYYLNTVLKPLLFIVAMPTGVLSCVIFKRQGLGDRMNLCLFVQVFIDLIFVCYSMVFSLAFWVRILEPIIGEELHVKMQYALSINYGLREASACISVLIAVERCVCVVFPLRANTLMSTRSMGFLLVAIVITMQLAFVTTPVKKYVYSVYDEATGGSRWVVAPSTAWQTSATLMLYDKVEDTLMMIVFPLVTFLLVSGATVITVVKLKAAISWREKISCSINTNVQSHQVALTKMLVIVSFVFIASKLPWVAFTLARIFWPDFLPSGSQSNIYKVSELMAHYFYYVHSSIDFFIYYARSSRFRSHLQALFTCSHKHTGVREMTKNTIINT